MGLSENVVYPKKPNGFADHYPVFKWLFHWGFGPHFQTYPYVDGSWNRTSRPLTSETNWSPEDQEAHTGEDETWRYILHTHVIYIYTVYKLPRWMEHLHWIMGWIMGYIKYIKISLATSLFRSFLGGWNQLATWTIHQNMVRLWTVYDLHMDLYGRSQTCWKPSDLRPLGWLATHRHLCRWNPRYS